MSDRNLIAAGAVGAVLAALCCAAPLLAVALGTLGLTAWFSKSDYVVIAALLICLVLIGISLYRRRAAAHACCDPDSYNHGATS